MNDLLDKLRRGDVLLDLLGNLQIEDAAEALDGRDAEPFDGNWIDSFNALADLPDAEAAEPAIDEIRERVFRIVFGATNSSELAGYVSDDFELIAKALLTNRNDEFVNALWSEYAAGRFPTGDLAPVSGSLAALISNKPPSRGV